MASVYLSARTREALETARLIIGYWDHALAEHMRVVALDMARLTPRHSPPNPQQVALWRWAGTLHDIGKIRIASDVLSKRGAYTESERRAMREHPRKGAEILRKLNAPELVVQAAEFHHEAWNGHGYPHGARGTAIPYIARVLAVADAYQAMTHARAYRPAYTLAQARLEIERLAGIQFDPQVVAIYFGAEPRLPPPVLSEKRG